ncbi:MAG TPA: tetratricopeptide repeat protein [Bryobacteraceae bacterium]|nr:tetratricopeptide repeat protein [Bryobacteraceae bacterium]
MSDAAPSAEAVREHLERILASPRFRAAESLRRLLRYTVEAALADRGETLKEYTVGIEALGRPVSFDPRQDTIVRAQARRLRDRLATYYEAEGRSEPCRIIYRPGTYLPVFGAARDAAANTQTTVAVLPFINLTADNAAGYFCDGLAEELVDLLARSAGLRVVARTSSFQFKGTQADVREIGERLGAKLLIEGAVRAAGDRYRITVRVLSADDGCEIWAGRYDRTLCDVLELEAEIAGAIASSLTTGAPPAVSATDAEGAMLYLQARCAWNKRTEAGFRRALELYAAAVERDPRAAKAWAGTAECHVLMNMHGLALPHVCMPQAREAATTALAIDPGLASAWSALAAVTAMYERRFDAAEEPFRRALESDSDSATTHHWHAMFGFAPARRLGEALEEMREAERLDPLSAPIANDVGFPLYWSRRFDEAVEQCRRASARHPEFYRSLLLLGRTYAAEGRYQESLDACLKARELMDGRSFLPYLLGTLGFSYASRGDLTAAEEVLVELVRLEQCAVTAHERALVAMALGRRDEAVGALGAAYEQRTGWASWVPLDPLYDDLCSWCSFDAGSFT